VRHRFKKARDLRERRKRFYIALAVYAILGCLAWMTMSSAPLPAGNYRLSMRLLTVMILAFFALRTLLQWKAERIREQDEEHEQV